MVFGIEGEGWCRQNASIFTRAPSPEFNGSTRSPRHNMRHPMTRLLFILCAALSVQTLFAALTPRLVGDWWTVAGDPDLGVLTNPKQQPVDFGIWQAADGTWQLWSCIRGTKEPGNTRLFHRWEGAKLTDKNWKPMGIAMQADPALGETRGGLQAPYVLRHANKYYMFYGDWANICL